MQSCEAENLGAEILLRRVFLLGSVTPVTLQAKLQKQKDQQAFVEAKAGGVGIIFKVKQPKTTNKH